MNQKLNGPFNNKFKYFLPQVKNKGQGLGGVNVEDRDEAGTKILRFYLFRESQNGLGWKDL